MTKREPLTADEKARLLHRVTITTNQQDAAEAAKHRAILTAKERGCTLEEIGAAMGIHWQSVRHHLRRAQRTLNETKE